MAVRMVAVLFSTMFAIANSLGAQAPAKSSPTAKPAEPEKKMTAAQKAAAWKGQRVTILGNEPLRCSDWDGYFQSGIQKADEKSSYAQLKRADYVGKAGLVLEATADGSEVAGLVELDNGEKLRVTRRYLGFQKELDTARSWIARDLWIRQRTSLRLEPGLCSRSGSERSEVPILEKLKVTGAEFGNEFTKVLIQVTSEDGQTAYLEGPVSYIHEEFAPDYHEPVASLFYSEDPQKKHPTWGPNAWKLVRGGKVAVGMTEEQATMACGGKMNALGFIMVGDAVSTINACGNNPNFLIENGKVKEYVEFRRVP